MYSGNEAWSINSRGITVMPFSNMTLPTELCPHHHISLNSQFHHLVLHNHFQYIHACDLLYKKDSSTSTFFLLKCLNPKRIRRLLSFVEGLVLVHRRHKLAIMSGLDPDLTRLCYKGTARRQSPARKAFEK